jgi:urease beta subunit
MARVTLQTAGEDVIVGGADVQVIGTTAGGEVITVVSGNVRLDGSFNAGGDTVVLPGAASSYTVVLVGSEAVFTRNDGSVTLRIPVGTAGAEIRFDGGDERTLQINTATGTVQLEGQNISTNASAPTQISAAPGGPAPTPGYTIQNTAVATTVEEGNSGTKLLVFTITLNRPVAASDGPLTLNYQTQDGSALSASDYVAGAGTVTFAVGQSVATVAVVINGDTNPEADESFGLRITGGSLLNHHQRRFRGVADRQCRQLHGFVRQ